MERHCGNRVEHSVLLMKGERPADSRSLQEIQLAFKTLNQGYTAAMHEIMTSIIQGVSKKNI